MARAALVVLILCVTSITPSALGACGGVGPAGVCANAAADGSSSAFACVATPAGVGCGTTSTRPVGGSAHAEGRVCVVGSVAPASCQDVGTSAAPAPEEAVALAMETAGSVLDLVRETQRDLDDFLPCDGVPPTRCPL